MLSLTHVLDRENLLCATALALKSKPRSRQAEAFLVDLEASLNQLVTRTLEGQVPLAKPRQFVVHDPKRRLITAPAFADRVLQHALFRWLGPRFDAALSPTVYACRKGFGLHAALLSVQKGLQRHHWYVQMDIDGYFPSIPHAPLLAYVGAMVPERALYDLLAKMVTNEVGRGLPIGALVSQYLANGYLASADAYLAQTHGFVRYMDDIIAFTASEAEARQVAVSLGGYLQAHLGVALKSKVRIARGTAGTQFCGYRVKPGVILAGARKMQRARTYAQKVQTAMVNGGNELDGQRAFAQWQTALQPATVRRFQGDLWSNT